MGQIAAGVLGRPRRPRQACRRSPSGRPITLTLDTLYSNFDVERRDNYILGLSFGRNVNNNGQPMVSVRDIAFDSHGSITRAR